MDFNWLIFVTCTLVLVGLATVIQKFYKVHKSLDFYRRQGIHCEFRLKSEFSLLDPKHPENERMNNADQATMDIPRKSRGKGCIAFNNFTHGNSILVFTEEKIMKEILLNEDSIHKVSPTPEWGWQLGFFFTNDQKGLEWRGMASEFLRYDLINDNISEMSAIFNEFLDRFCKEKELNCSEFKTVEIQHEMIEKMVDLIMMKIIFGDSTPLISKTTGKVLTDLVQNSVRLMSKIRIKPLYFLIPELCLKYRLLKDIRLLYDEWQDMLDIVKGEYQSRESRVLKDPSSANQSVLNRIIHHNHQARLSGNLERVLTFEEVACTVNVLLFAGTDTTATSATNLICKSVSQTQIREIPDQLMTFIFDKEGITTREKIESSDLLTSWVKEAQRIGLAVHTITRREVTRDLTLGGIKLRKGDLFKFHYLPDFFDEAVFPDPGQFDEDRFSPEKLKSIPRHQFTPFSVGKRACIGKHLAEVSLKLIWMLFFRKFDVQKAEEGDYSTNYTFLRGVKIPKVKLRMRSN